MHTTNLWIAVQRNAGTGWSIVCPSLASVRPARSRVARGKFEFFKLRIVCSSVRLPLKIVSEGHEATTTTATTATRNRGNKRWFTQQHAPARLHHCREHKIHVSGCRVDPICGRENRQTGRNISSYRWWRSEVDHESLFPKYRERETSDPMCLGGVGHWFSWVSHAMPFIGRCTWWESTHWDEFLCVDGFPSDQRDESMTVFFGWFCAIQIVVSPSLCLVHSDFSKQS